jgi:hypothetical protein
MPNLPTKASPRAAQAMGRRPAMPAQAQARGFSKGGQAKMTEQERQMMQEVQDEKDRKKAGEAYDKASTSTMPAPKKKAGGGMVKGYADGGSVRPRGMGKARGGKCKTY